MTAAAPEHPVETEAKLHASLRAFEALWGAEEIAGWRATARRDVSLRDTYWDTADGRLARAGGTLRVRELSGAPGSAGSGGAPGGVAAELTLKGPLPAGQESGAAGVWSRTELTVTAPPGSGPGEWASLPAARPVLTALERLGAWGATREDGAGGLRPDIVLLNPRREIVLARGADEVVLSLDEVAVEGAPYRRRYVEVELKRGEPGVLEGLVDGLVRRFGLRPSRRGKVQAARAWMERRRAGRGSQGPPLSR